jgi:hypothetical protein
LFKTHDVDVTVSLDGPADINDKYRVDFKGRGTLAQTLQGLERLRAAGLEPGLISVCNPGTDPERVLAFVADELGMKQFDVLPPDATHTDNPPPIADYFIKLFDVWFDKYAEKGVRIDTLDAMIRGLAGQLSLSDTIGLGPIETVTLMADGSLEPLDVLRIAGDGWTASKTYVRGHAIKNVENELAGSIRGQHHFVRDLSKMRIFGRMRRRSLGAALVRRAQVRQPQRLLRELEAHLRPYLGPDRAHIDGRSRARRRSPLSAPRWCRGGHQIEAISL